MDRLIETFCLVDDFCQSFMPEFEQKLLSSGVQKRRRPSRLSLSEIMALMIHFHQSHYRDFKYYYLNYVRTYLSSYFPGLVSYNRFVELMPRALLPLCLFLQAQPKTKTGIYFVDSTPLEVCHVKRASSNKVFQGLARKSRSTIGWYFGFKLHIVVNDLGELMAFKLTPSTVDDRKPLKTMTGGLWGKLIGDKGYLSKKLFEQLYENGLKLITKIKKNMKNQFVPLIDKLLLRKRAIVESVFDQLKNISQIQHSRHRSINNFMVNLVSGLAAYSLQTKKPSIQGIKHMSII